MISEFEVYLRGIGFKSLRDEKERFFLFRKSQKNRFPKKDEIVDQLICLSLIYGDSHKMGVDQQITKARLKLPPPYSKQHDHPCDMPEKVLKQKLIVKAKNLEQMEMKCSNWGCDKEYMSDRNDKKVC